MNQPSQNATAETNPVQFSLDSWGQLVFIDGMGERHCGGIPIRLFPITSPQQFISICKSNGVELACLESLGELSAESRKALEDELSRREFVPIVHRVVHVSGNTEPTEWTIETDRGTTRFVLKDEDDIRRLGEFGVLIFDAHGIRYLIPDERRLDAYSKRIIEWYV